MCDRFAVVVLLASLLSIQSNRLLMMPITPPTIRSLVKAVTQMLLLVILGIQPFATFRTSFAAAAPCRDRFIPHDLAHTTTTSGALVRFYQSNGSGLAINDLNNDGLLDVVLGNLKGANTILWNEGGLHFRQQPISPTGRTRTVQIVDVDGDGWQDIVMTTQLATPLLWHNDGDETFTRVPLRGVTTPAYVMQWADVDGDGDLDLVTASYDTELSRELGNSFLLGAGAGVVAYDNQHGTFVPTRLAKESQALAIWLSDLNDDGQMDLFIGNDFSFPDQAWTHTAQGWQAVEPFAETAFSTMSFDAGDVNNDGRYEFFAADMLPYEADETTRRIWQPVLDALAKKPLPPDNRQVFENVLQQRNASGAYVNQAAAYGVTATGWSWSSKFGDLNGDGFLDLYSVNGMAALELFANQPGAELVETNLAFRNQSGERFVPAPEWGLGSLRGGRGMSMADLDGDGDLDIVVNNLNAPAQLFENDLCGGAYFQVDLRHAGAPNPAGIGSRLTLVTTGGTFTRDVRAGSGYLSGDPSRVHFGFPAGTQVQRLEVRWPDGFQSVVDVTNAPALLTLTR